MIAVTSQTSPLASSSDYLAAFFMDDYIGGRYSSTSAVGGAVLSLAFGPDVFARLRESVLLKPPVADVHAALTQVADCDNPAPWYLGDAIHGARAAPPHSGKCDPDCLDWPAAKSLHRRPLAAEARFRRPRDAARRKRSQTRRPDRCLEEFSSVHVLSVCFVVGG